MPAAAAVATAPGLEAAAAATAAAAAAAAEEGAVVGADGKVVVGPMVRPGGRRGFLRSRADSLQYQKKVLRSDSAHSDTVVCELKVSQSLIGGTL